MGKGVTLDFNANLERWTGSIDKATNDLSKFQTNAERVSRNIAKSMASVSAAKIVPGGVGPGFQNLETSFALIAKGAGKASKDSMAAFQGIRASVVPAGAAVNGLAMSYGSAGASLKSYAANFTGYTKGVGPAVKTMGDAADKGGKSMAGLSKGTKAAGDSAAQAKGNFSGLTPVILKNYLAYLALQKSITAITDEFSRGFKAVEDYKVSVASTAGFISTFSAKSQSGDLAGGFAEAYAYSERLIPALEKMDALTIASGEDMNLISMALIKNGVLLDVNNDKQKQGFLNIATALKAMFANTQNGQLQMNQEITALMSGQVRSGDKLAQLLKAKDPMLQEHLKLWKEQGTVIEHIGDMLGGFGFVADKLKGSWAEVGSTLETIHTVILREGFKPVVEDILVLANRLKDTLMDSKGNLTDVGKGLQETIKDTYKTLKEMAGITAGMAGGWTAATAALTLYKVAIGEATALTRVFNVVSALNPWVALATAGAGAGIWFKQYLDKFQEENDAASEAIAETKRIRAAMAVEFTDSKSGTFGEAVAANGGTQSFWSVESMALGQYREELKGLEDFNMVKAPKLAPPAGDEDGTVSAMRDASLKKIELLKANQEAMDAVTKAGADLRLANEQRGYDMGLISLQDYLTSKRKAEEAEMAAEVAARRTELANLQADFAKFKDDPKKKAAENDKERSEYLIKIANAQKAVTEAESQQSTGRVKALADERKAIDDQLTGYQELRATILELNGDYVGAAAVRQKIDEGSVERQKLIAEAFTGDPVAMQAYWDQEAIDIQKSVEAYRKAASQKAEIDIAGINAKMAEIDTEEKFYGINAIQAAKKKIPLLEQELSVQQAISDHLRGTTPEEIAAWQQQQEKIRALKDEMLGYKKVITDSTAFGGMIGGLKEYSNAAMDMGAQVKDAVTGAFSGMEDAMVTFVQTGKASFSDMVSSIEADFIRLMVRTSITGPLAEAASGFFGFADGGVMSGAGPMSLKKYAGGGIASSPQLAMFGEGSMKEAFVPLPDGRSIPVTIRGGGSGGDVIVNVNNTSGAQVTARQRPNAGGPRVVDIFIEQVKSAIAGDIVRGTGAVPRAIEGTYGANRMGGAY